MTRFTAVEAAAAIRRWYTVAIDAVDPTNAVENHLQRDGRYLIVDRHVVEVSGRLFVAAIGKAAATMADGARNVLGDLISSGVIITKDGHLGGIAPVGFESFEASHPIPDDRGRVATERLLQRLAELGPDDVVLVLLSGGGSALLEAPVDGVSMNDMAATTGLLLRAGAPIQHLNAVRVPLSKVKGGGLRRAAPDARFVSLLLSDVLGNDSRVIASGPTVPSNFSGAGALVLLQQYDVIDRCPKSVRLALELVPDPQSSALFERDIVFVVGDNSAAVEAVARSAETEGVHVSVLLEDAEGEARELARSWVGQLLAADNSIDLLLGGGEATVTVRGDGTGGRNTEFALAAALELERAGHSDWVVASLATDGQDALTGVAGAIASVETLRRSRNAGIDPATALERNDSLSVFRTGGGCVEPGPTGTNVNDIYFALRIVSSSGS